MRTCKYFLLVAMAFCLAACASVKTTTTTNLNPEGKPTSVVQQVSGPVEGMAAVQHAAVANKVVEMLPQLTHKITLPRGLDANGKQLEPYTMILVDSAAYTVAKMAMDFSGYESPEIKALRQVMKMLSKLTPWAGAWLIADAIAGSAGTHEYNFANSFNNNKQSPNNMFNGHASSQQVSLTNTEDNHTDNSTTDDHTDNSTPAESN